MPQDYYLEGIKRDPGDIRCNTSMARLCLKNGEFERCVNYCDIAIKRLTSRNQHPTDTEAFYLKGLALAYLGKNKDAYDVLYKAAWNYTHRSAAYFELACLDCKNGDFVAALEKLDESIQLNAGHTKAQNLKTAILRRLDKKAAEQSAQTNVRDDLLDLFAKIEYSHFAGNREDIEPFAVKAENLLDVACDYMKAGFIEDALYTLDFYQGEYPLVEYYKAYCKKDPALIQKAESMDTGFCFPSRLEDIEVLAYAVNQNEKAVNACYYLGSLYYDRFRYEDAANIWEEGCKRDNTHGKIWRNLSLYYFDKANQPEKAKACMENALKFKSDDPRLLLEYQQLLKNMNFSVEDRLAVYEKYPELLAQRDDCYLDRLTLISQTGDYETAIQTARAKRFHIYEGGEGKLTKQHAWMHVLYGNRLAADGDDAAAEKAYADGVNMPKSYGEAKTFFNQEAHIFYFLGRLYEKQEKSEDAVKAYKEAAVYKAAVSEISLFRALALQKLSLFEESKAVIEEMLTEADNKIKNKDLRSYYGVGSPSPMPFENDIEKNNLLDGYILRAFALLESDRSASEEAARAAQAISPYDFRLYTYHQIQKTLDSLR